MSHHILHCRPQSASVTTARNSRSVSGSLPCSTGGKDIIALSKRQHRSGAKFASLWQGNRESYFNSHSEADSSLVFTLAFYTKDAAQIDRIFRTSGLMRDKWDERHGEQTYGEMTIARALEKVTKQYQPKGNSRPSDNVLLPGIQTNDVQLNEQTATTIDAIKKANDPPQLFVRSGKLTRVMYDENAQPIIERLGCAEMRCFLSEETGRYPVSQRTSFISQIMI
jgi:primase-polymerase (primpol)-like protein